MWMGGDACVARFGGTRSRRRATQASPPRVHPTPAPTAAERIIERTFVETLLEQLEQSCERFAAIIEHIPDTVLDRQGVHGESGPITLRYCVEAPIQSASEHLEQLRVVQTGG